MTGLFYVTEPYDLNFGNTIIIDTNEKSEAMLKSGSLKIHL